YGQAGDLMLTVAAEPLGDDLLDIVGTTLLALLVATNGAAPAQVEPAVVQQNARRQLVFEDDLRLVEDTLALRVAQHLDDVLDALRDGGDAARGAVLVGDLLRHLAVLVAGAGPPLQDVGRAVVGEGHAHGVDNRRLLGDDLDLDPLGGEVALEARVLGALV